MSKLVIVESPYAGDIEANVEYARAACLDCILRNENPFASHLFYPQFLNDDEENDRWTGINCGYEWGHAAAQNSVNSVLIAFYVDRGWSLGMEAALARYTEQGFRCEIRRLPTETKPGT